MKELLEIKNQQMFKNEQLFFCYGCDGYAMVATEHSGKVIVIPCACEEENN